METIANTEMAAAWDGAEGDDWTENARYYEAAGDSIWQRLLHTVAIGTGDRVLDIGCGTGKSTRDVARIVTAGSVVGVDLSSRMLEHARLRSKEDGLTNVEFVQGDAQVHPFEAGAFDVAVSSFGAMFFADPVAAFSNIGGALRTDGRLAVLAWQRFERNEWLTAIFRASSAGQPLPTPPTGHPGPFGLADPDEVRDRLGRAGFVDVELASIEDPVQLGTDADDAWSFVSKLGIVRGLTSELDDAAKQAVFAALRAMVDAHATPDGVLFGSSAWLITARSS